MGFLSIAGGLIKAGVTLVQNAQAGKAAIAGGLIAAPTRIGDLGKTSQGSVKQLSTQPPPTVSGGEWYKQPWVKWVGIAFAFFVALFAAKKIFFKR